MKKLIAGTLIGAGLTFIVLWSIGFRKPRDEWSLAERQRKTIKGDISWFAQIDGYPELVYKDSELVTALREPERVTVYRVKDGGDVTIACFGLSSPSKVSKDDMEYFSKVVCSPTSMTNTSACPFSPGFAIQFDHGESSYYALVCYSCNDIFILDAEGECVAGWGMTYEAAFALIHRFYKIFPDDSEVQSLKF